MKAAEIRDPVLVSPRGSMTPEGGSGADYSHHKNESRKGRACRAALLSQRLRQSHGQPVEMLGEPPSTIRPCVSRVYITPEPQQQLHDGQDVMKSNPEIVTLQGSLTLSFHRLELLNPAVRNGLANCLVAAREQTGASHLAALDHQNVLEAQNHILAAAELGLAFPSPALCSRDASVQPRDLLSGCNRNLGNIHSARELYKVHSPRCMTPLCREYPW